MTFWRFTNRIIIIIISWNLRTNYMVKWKTTVEKFTNVAVKQAPHAKSEITGENTGRLRLTLYDETCTVYDAVRYLLLRVQQLSRSVWRPRRQQQRNALQIALFGTLLC